MLEFINILQDSDFAAKAIDIAARELIAVATNGEGKLITVPNY